MRKYGDTRDVDRRKKHVSILQDGEDWKLRRKLPPANTKWATCLIIAPSSVVPNWEREFETVRNVTLLPFDPSNSLQWGYFEVGLYTGTSRADVLRDFKLGRLDVMITSFTTARTDIALLDDLPWSCVIIDEAHRLSNAKSKGSLAYSQLACPIRFGLSGTGTLIIVVVRGRFANASFSDPEQIRGNVGHPELGVPRLCRLSQAMGHLRREATAQRAKCVGVPGTTCPGGCEFPTFYERLMPAQCPTSRYFSWSPGY